MQGLDFKDITLTPRVLSTIESRNDIDLRSNLGTISCLPVIASPMKDVCDGNMANCLRNNGDLGIIHRFCTIDEQISMVKQADCGAAVGINGDYLERFDALRHQTKLFCVDVANGFHINVYKAISKFLDIDKSVSFIAGNVGSKEGFSYLQDIHNVIGIRVGIGGGSACTTKIATGVKSFSASVILECKSVKKNAAIIFDGGIREVRDAVKAIALGADFVMMGSTLAACMESPAKIIHQNDKYYKTYNGSASFEIQSLYKNKPKYIEGRTRLLPYNSEPVSVVLEKFMDGLRSSMSYFNALDIPSYHKNVTWDVIYANH